MKTLLRYPGGKSRAVKKIVPYFPKDLKEMCSPFFGGGAIELEMDSKGVVIHGYDSFKALVNFWQSVIYYDLDMMYYVEKVFNSGIDNDTFRSFKEQISLYEAREFKRSYFNAARFYIVNRCSFNGTTLSGGMSPNTPRFNKSSVKRLFDFRSNNISVHLLDFETSINNHKNIFKYCDPPYIIESNLYGVKGDKHKNFDHERLYKTLSDCDNWILSYNDCEWVRETYKDYKIVEIDFAYGMSKSKTELLIINV